MKQLFLMTSICLFTGISSPAQYSKFGFTAGSAFANYKTKYDMIEISGKSKSGITVGVLADFPMGNNISFQPNLNFVRKGIKYGEDYGNGSFEQSTTSVNYLELPMNFLFNIYGKSGTFFVGGGPSFSFAISGKRKYEDEIGSESGDLEFGNDSENDDMRGFDFGANMLAGYRFTNGLFLSADYNVGLSNLMPGGSNEGTLKSNYFSIKLGFSIEKKLCKKK